jgi:uncharacterized membrane protein
VSVKVLHHCPNHFPFKKLKLTRRWLSAGVCRCDTPLNNEVASYLWARLLEAEAARARRQAPAKAKLQAAMVADRLTGNVRKPEPKRWAPRLAAHPPHQLRRQRV